GSRSPVVSITATRPRRWRRSTFWWSRPSWTRPSPWWQRREPQRETCRAWRAIRAWTRWPPRSTTQSVTRARPRSGPALARPPGRQVMYDRGDSVSFGLDKADDFAICQGDGARTTKAHVAFVGESREAVDAFCQAAMANGGREKHRPSLRPEYHPGYYGAFVL